MDNLHKIDEEMATNIRNMLNSGDVGNIRLALEILNNCDKNDKETINNTIENILHKSYGLHFSFFADENQNPKVVFHYDHNGVFVNETEITITYKPWTT